MLEGKFKKTIEAKNVPVDGEPRTFLTDEQVVPGTDSPEKVEMADLRYINPDWWHKTQTPFQYMGKDLYGTIVKPANQFDFIVDTTGMYLDNPLSPYADTSPDNS